jgi:tol-pal system protein YbgF
LLILSTSSAYAVPVLDNSDYRPPQPITVYTPVVPVSVATTSAPSSYQLADSINRLQSDVSQLKTKISEQSKVLTDLKHNQDSINANFDKRLSSVTGAGAALVSPTAYKAKVIDPHTTASADEKIRYEAAYAVLRNGAYDQAISQFQALQAAYPNGAYADNALYWMGEAYLKKGDKGAAMQMFDNVVRNYPKGGKVSDSLYKLGITQLSLKKTANAKEYFDYLIANYPGSPAAGLAITKKAQAGIY